MRAVGVFFVLATTCTISYIYDMSRFPYVLFETWSFFLYIQYFVKKSKEKEVLRISEKEMSRVQIFCLIFQ